jgi:mannan polymerase II complex MNN10 subunit
MVVIVLVVVVLVIVVISSVLYKSKAKPRICICMSHTRNIYSYSKLAVQINSLYAKKHGYDFKVFEKEMTDRAPQWVKVSVVRDLLEGDMYDYVFWIDADAFFNKQDKTLESIIELDPEKDFIICDDSPNSGNSNTVNTGTFLIKNTDWSKRFLSEWYNYTGEYLYKFAHEQQVLYSFLEKYKENILVTDSRLFNSAWSDYNAGVIGKYFIVHLMSLSEEIRVQYMTDYIKNMN